MKTSIKLLSSYSLLKYIQINDFFLQNSYQPTILNRARYMSISAMPAYSNYSHEEIRLGYLRDVVVKDAVQLKQVNKSCYAGYWTPSCSGNYRIECKVDGFELSHTYTLQVGVGIIY